MVSLFVEGLLFGVVPAFFVGPVLLTLVHASLRGGFWAGASVALGIALSDVIAIALCALGVGALLTTSWGEAALGVVGGLILLVFFCVMQVGRPPKLEAKAVKLQGVRHFVSGFLVNFVNPFVFAFWVGALGVVSERHDFEPSTLAWFFGGTLTMILATDLLKAWLASALERHLSGPSLLMGQRISGVLLMGAGIYISVSVLWTLSSAL